jgi:hypothetical protein
MFSLFFLFLFSFSTYTYDQIIYVYINNKKKAMLIAVDRFVATLSHVELMLDQACSLLYRFPEAYDLVDALLRGEVKLNEDYKQSVFMFLDSEHQKTRSQPSSSSSSSRPTLGGRSESDASIENVSGHGDDISDSNKDDDGGGGDEATDDDGDAINISSSELQAAEAERLREVDDSEDEPLQQQLARPTEREYILRFTSQTSIAPNNGNSSSSSSSSSSLALSASVGASSGGTASSMSSSDMVTVRMGCLVNEADTFPTTRAVRVTLRVEKPDANC